MHGCTACNYVYLDEVGTDSRVTNKRRGWIQKGEDSETSKMIFVRGRKFTTIAAMCTTGIVATLTFEGAADKKTLLTFIIESVIPHMNPFPGEKSVLIMDNAAIHDKSALSVLGQLHNFMVIPLPPYSPIFNPIENMFGTYKTWLRRNRDLVCHISPYDATDRSGDEEHHPKDVQ